MIPDTHAASLRARPVAGARATALAIALLILSSGVGEAAISVTVSWDKNPDSATVGYYVYYGTQSHNYTTSINVGNTTTAVIYVPDQTVTYYFAVQAVSATGERSQLSAETVWTPSQAPTLRNPGNQTGVVGLSVTLQLSATDPRSLPFTYSAGGLPPGLSISSSTGRISGTLSTAGTFNVIVAATNAAGVSASQSFTWGVVGPNSSGGGGGSVGTPPPLGGGLPGGGGPGLPGGSSPGLPGGGGPGSGGGVGTYPPADPGGNPANGGGNGAGTNPVTPGPDLSPPKIIVISPTTENGTYRTVNVRIIVTGLTSDDVGVVSVMWANSRGGAGSALGTSSWATTPIELKLGDNVLTIIASDAAGNVQTATFTVTRIVDLVDHLN